MNKHQNILATSQEAREKRRDRLYVPAALAAAALTAALGLPKFNFNSESSGPWDRADNNPQITNITLEEGARIRSTPTVIEGKSDGISNRLISIDTALSIPLINGSTPYYSEREGQWYSIPVDTLKVAYPDGAKALDKDQDGKVWVSSQKAEVTETPESINNQ